MCFQAVYQGRACWQRWQLNVGGGGGAHWPSRGKRAGGGGGQEGLIAGRELGVGRCLPRRGSGAEKRGAGLLGLLILLLLAQCPPHQPPGGHWAGEAGPWKHSCLRQSVSRRNTSSFVVRRHVGLPGAGRVFAPPTAPSSPLPTSHLSQRAAVSLASGHGGHPGPRPALHPGTHASLGPAVPASSSKWETM